MRSELLCGVSLKGVTGSHRFSLLINSLINFLDRVDFEGSLCLGLRFYRSNSIILSLYLHFSTVKHLLLAFDFKKKLAKFSSIFA